MATPATPATPATSAAPATSAVSATARRLAAADFSALAQRFADAGFDVVQPARGIVTISSVSGAPRASVLVSVGVHGDETGPIEVLAEVLDALSQQPLALAVDLMVCVGNIDAIAAGTRFIDADLNRMFRPLRGALASAAEAARADAMIACTDTFFAKSGALRWHLDLHTAIRPSQYSTFAVVPDLLAPQRKAALIDWLGQAAIGAIIMNPQSAGTYSYYSAEHHGAAAGTVELGRVGTLGQNDLSLFADVHAALETLLRGADPDPDPDPDPAATARPHVFKVAQEIIKLSDDFSMAFGRATHNFSPLRAGQVIATDGATIYRVGAQEELVVFPNPDVRVGLRAALMVVRTA